MLALLLDVEQRCAYPEKQKALLKCEVLEILDEVSPSSKTRKKARELVKKYL